jgi:hypothetical protein
MAIAAGPPDAPGGPVTRPGDQAGTAAPQVPPELVARWRQGEERLYASALTRADVYELSVDLVCRTAAHLRGLGEGQGPLLAAAERGAELVVDALGGAAPARVRVDLAGVAQAALALRHRQVLAEQAASQRVRAMRDARGRGDVWVVLEESGDAGGSPFLPYRRLEAHAGTGRAVLVTTSPDPTLTTSLHAVEGLLVDPVTGALQELGDARARAGTCERAGERERRAAALREELADG